MATYTIIKLVHLSALHIGTGKENYDFSAADLHSDTLSAAVAAMRAQQGQADDLDNFLNSFTLSSAFPFCGNRYFLPKTHGRIQVKVEGKEEHLSRKKLKRIKYIEYPLWQQLIAGNELEVEEQQLNGDFLTVEALPYRSISMTQVNQRVSVSRMEGEEADPFFFDWRFFSEGTGLYCLTDATGELLGEIISFFERLGEIGLGTDKSVGGGKFQVETDTMEICAAENANDVMLLSLYLPTKEELATIDLKQSSYDLLLRGGYMAGSSSEAYRHLRKQSIYMFGVGSLLHTQQPLHGKVVDLKPNQETDMHSIYRSGRPIYVPVKRIEL